MRAIVLVGGEGTRLRPLTWRTPKQLVPVLNRPLLEHLLLHLRAHDVTAVTLAMTRRSDAVRQAFDDGGALGMSIDYAYEETPLGSGGAIASVARGWREPFLVCNGDIITDLDLTAFVVAHREAGAEVSISLHEVDDPSQFGVVVQEPGGRVSRFVEKPSRECAPSRMVNAGTWLFAPSALAQLDPTRFNRVEDELFPALAADGRLFGYAGSSYWVDVGNPEAYRRVNLDLLAGAVPECLPAGWPPSGIATTGATIAREAAMSAPALVGAGTRVEAGARVVGPSAVGASCLLERDSEVRGSVLWDGVRVGVGAHVADSVLATGCTIGAGATVTGAVVGHEADVPASARVPPGTRIEPGARFPAEG